MCICEEYEETMPRRVSKGAVVEVSLADDLHEIPGPNPNVLTTEEEMRLRASIVRHGYRQLLTVVERDEGGYWISDGVHRRKLLMELGYTKVSALSKEGTVDTVRAERLSLNKNRGHVDLAAASADLQLLEEAGWARSDMVALGWGEDELDVLLRKVTQTDEQILEEGLEAGPALEQTTEPAKRYTLTFTFDSKDERDALRGRLLDLGPSIEEGLRAILGRGRQ